MKSDDGADLLAKLARHPLLEGLSPTDVAALCELGSFVRHPTGDVILREGERGQALFLLLSGTARVYFLSAEGIEVTAKFFQAPSVFGELECLAGLAWLETVTVIDRATLFRVPADRVPLLIERFPTFTRRLLVDVSQRFCILIDNAKSLAFLPVPVRLANLMLMYARGFGVPVEGGLRIRISLSQTRLANDLAVALKSVNRTLASWIDEGVIEKRRDGYVILRHDALEELAKLDSFNLRFMTGGGIGRVGAGEE